MNNTKTKFCKGRNCYNQISSSNKSELCTLCYKKQYLRKKSKKKVIKKEEGINEGMNYAGYLKANKFVGVARIGKI